MKKITWIKLTILFAVAITADYIFHTIGGAVSMAAAFVGCVQLSDDTQDGTNCPVATAGIEGKYRILPYGAIVDYGERKSATKTWDDDFVMSDLLDSWAIHDTDDDVAVLTSESQENGTFINTVTLFYDGDSPARRAFFNDAITKKAKFDIAITDNDGVVQVCKKVMFTSSYTTGTSAGGEKKGYSVTATYTGAMPMIYTGALV